MSCAAINACVSALLLRLEMSLHLQRVPEYPELDGTHNDRQRPSPVPALTPQQSYPVPGSVVQTLLELKLFESDGQEWSDSSYLNRGM